MEHMNQELEQYLRFFMENRQKNWPEWLASAEFTVNNKTHIAMIKPATLTAIPSKIWGFATSAPPLLTSLAASSPPPTPPASRA